MKLKKTNSKKLFDSILIWFFCIPILFGCTKASTASIPSICSNGPAPCLQGKAIVKITTTRGNILVEVNGDSAPLTAGNFIDLVNKGVYNGTIFHRVIRTPVPFVVQGGDPLSKEIGVPKKDYGTGNYIDKVSSKARLIPLEIKLKSEVLPRYSQQIIGARYLDQLQIRHQRGSLAMARSKEVDSASAQFYIALKALPELDGRYSVFGKVLKGIEIIDEIEQGDQLIKAILVQN